MATEQGIVTRTQGRLAWVKTVRTEACESCSAKSSCHALGGGNEMEVEVLNTAGAGEGDRVVLTFESGSLLKATFLIYVFPILVMIGGAFFGQEVAESLQMNEKVVPVVFAFLFLGAALFLVKRTGNRMALQDRYRPRISRIVGSAPKPPENCTPQ